MVFYDRDTVRQILTSNKDNTTHDDLIAKKGPEADDRVSDIIYKSVHDNRNIKSLPVISISAGTINGDAISTNLSNAASNMAAALCFHALAQKERGETYERLAIDAIKTYIMKLESKDSQIVGLNV